MAEQKKVIITLPAKPKPAAKIKPTKKAVKPKKKEQKKEEETELFNGLTFKQRQFCIEYLKHQCNGTLAALLAFDITDKEIVTQEPPKERYSNGKLENQAEIEEFEKTRKKVESVASTMANEYLRKPDVIKFIHNLLVETGLTDEYVDLQLFKVIDQDYDNKTKVAAIKEYNAMKGRLKPKEIKHSGSIGLAAAYEAAAGGEEDEDGDN